MQNPQMAAQMAAMNANNANGPIDGTPTMGNMQHPNKRTHPDPREQLNTYIYDYFLRNSHTSVARAMIDNDIKMATNPAQKTSPKNRSNGIDPMDDSGHDLPVPQLPSNQLSDNSFLLDWWVQFWDIYQATKNRGTGPAKGAQYIQHTRNLAQLQNDQRSQRMMMNNPMNAQYQNMMRNGMPNGVAPNDLKRAAAMNNRPNGNPMANMGQMKNPMMAAQMQRDGSNMDMNGQRPQSPGANENAPSPNKRPRMEGGMNAGVPGGQFGEFAGPGQNPQQKNMEVYAQSLAQQHRVALNNTASPQGMNPGVQGSPMGQSGLDGQQDMFAGNGPRPGMPANAPGAPPQQGNHALQDYQMQLMLLEQQNKKRLLMARQEQDNMSGPQHQAGVGAQGFPAAMSPQGNRPGPSPNPADQMKRGTPKLGQGMPPGSPLPEGAMQQQRGSPAPNMNFDPNLAPPGMPPQFYPQMPQQSPMIRPPSSHPGGNFNGQQPNPQQMEAMRNGQMPPNGWRGPQQMGMMPSQHPMGGPMGNNPQQRQQMPPPPAPASDQPRPEPSPSQSNQAPPTPSQSNKAAPKKKATKETTKKAPNKKGANTGATPAASNGEEPPTPTSSTPVAPITPHSKQSFGNQQNNQPQQSLQPQQQQAQQAQQQQQQQAMDNGAPPFGTMDADPSLDFNMNFEEGALGDFDFDSFLQQPGDDGAFGNLTQDFDFHNVAEVEGGL